MYKAVIKAATETISAVCGQELVMKQAYMHKRDVIDNAVAVTLEFTGGITGKVVIRFTEDNAKKTASAMMCGMPVEEIDAMAASALSELGNMIMGGAAINIAANGFNVDITTPQITQGSVNIKGKGYTISVPLENGNLRIVLDVTFAVDKDGKPIA